MCWLKENKIASEVFFPEIVSKKQVNEVIEGGTGFGAGNDPENKSGSVFEELRSFDGIWEDIPCVID